MNNEVESYRNDELVSILNASILLQKKKTVRAGTRKRSKLKYRFNYLCLYFNT